MKIEQTKVSASGIMFSIKKDGEEIGRAYLYLLYNGLHSEPFGLLEDVFVEEEHRGKGLGTKLVEAVISAAKQNNCYKLFGTSRHSRKKVHDWYKKLGFYDQGLEFRMDFKK